MVQTQNHLRRGLYDPKVLNLSEMGYLEMLQTKCQASDVNGSEGDDFLYIFLCISMPQTKDNLGQGCYGH